MFRQNPTWKVLSLLSVAFAFNFISGGTASSKSKKSGSSITESPAYKEAYDWLRNYIDSMIKKGEAKVVIVLIPSSKELNELIVSLLSIDKLISRIQIIGPSVQKKIREATEADRQKLEKDPEFIEMRELTAKYQILMQQADIIKDQALELFKSRVIAMNKNVILVIANADLSRSDDQPDDNHPLLKAQQLYKFCIMEAHASTMQQIKQVQEEMEKAKKDQDKDQLKSEVVKEEKQKKSGVTK